MTLAEAITVMKIMATADNWCSQCGSSLISDFVKAFPQFADIQLKKSDIDELHERFNDANDMNIENDIWEYPNVWEV